MASSTSSLGRLLPPILVRGRGGGLSLRLVPRPHHKMGASAVRLMASDSGSKDGKLFPADQVQYDPKPWNYIWQPGKKELKSVP